jgi:beta-N-acetylhexosaminidase
MRATLLLLLALFTMLSVPYSTVTVHARPAQQAQVDSILREMPLDQRVGQLFMVSVYGQGLPDTSSTFLREMAPGAVALFTYNGATPREVTYTVNAWQTIATQIGSRIPLIVAIDQEGGPVTRLTTGFTQLPWGAALGAMPVADARKVGQLAAEELRAVGINMNLAPVVDVRTPDGIFVERRTIGPDPRVVAEAGSAYVQGLQERRVIAVLKHFPGHGPASDSHATLPTINFSRARVEAVELAPFRAGIQRGAEVVMVGHLAYPALDPTPDLPASLSPVIIGEVLRKELGFTGVAMTDAMDMGAIAERYTRPIAAVMAIRAGIDLIATGPHMPMSDQLAMKAAILDAVKRGEISEARIEESVRRVLTMKAKYGLLTWSPLDADKADERVNVAEHQPIVDAIYLNTIAIAEDSGKRLPLVSGAQKIGIIFPGVYPSVQRECAVYDKPTTALAYTLNPRAEEIQSARAVARDVDFVLIFTYNIIDYPLQAMMVNAVPPEKAIVISLQSPYDIERGIQPAAYVAAFNSYAPAFRAACAVLYGKQPAVGRWPWQDDESPDAKVPG